MKDQKQNLVTRIFDSVYSTIQFILVGGAQTAVDTFTAIVLNVAMLAVPVLPAYSIYTLVLETSQVQWVAIVAAVAIELASIFIAKVFFQVVSWNNVATLKSDEKIDLNHIGIAALTYYGLVFINTTAIEIFDWANVILYPSFVIMAIAAYSANWIGLKVTALQNARDERIAESAEKTQLGKEIKQRQTELKSLQAQIDETISNRTSKVDQAVRKAHEALEAITIEIEQAEMALSGIKIKVQAKNDHQQKITSLKPNVRTVYNMTISGDLTAKNIASEIGITERTVQTYWKQLRDLGLIDAEKNPVNPILNGQHA